MFIFNYHLWWSLICGTSDHTTSDNTCATIRMFIFKILQSIQFVSRDESAHLKKGIFYSNLFELFTRFCCFLSKKSNARIFKICLFQEHWYSRIKVLSQYFLYINLPTYFPVWTGPILTDQTIWIMLTVETMIHIFSHRRHFVCYGWLFDR